MRRLFIALILLAAACSGGDEAATTTTATSTTSTTAPTTTPTTTTTVPGVARPGAIDVGDSLYPGLGNGGYDVAHYDIALVIDPDTDSLAGIVTIEATATQTLSGFNLDFIGFDVERITVDGVEAEFGRDGAELVISPGDPISSGATFTTAIKYAGTHSPFRPEAFGGGEAIGWTEGSDGTEYVISEPDATRSWMPVNDHPSDKATFTFSLTVPNDVIAIANGTNTGVITDIGSDTWEWEMDEPMAPYLATVIVGDYEIVTDDTGPVPIRNAFPAGYRVPVDVDSTNEMMDMFIDLIGPYPFDEYGIAVVRGFGFALENQTLSVFGPDLVYEDVLVHELAHQWFGNAVTPADWGDIWLNEGFATYAEFLWAERRFGRDFVESQFRGIRDAINGDSSFSPPGAPPRDALFNGGVYIRGAMVLHALRLEIGDDAFFETLQTYYERYRNGTVRTADFVAVTEEVSGHELGDVFDAWLYQESIPEFPGS